MLGIWGSHPGILHYSPSLAPPRQWPWRCCWASCLIAQVLHIIPTTQWEAGAMVTPFPRLVDSTTPLISEQGCNCCLLRPDPTLSHPQANLSTSTNLGQPCPLFLLVISSDPRNPLQRCNYPHFTDGRLCSASLDLSEVVKPESDRFQLAMHKMVLP